MDLDTNFGFVHWFVLLAYLYTHAYIPCLSTHWNIYLLSTYTSSATISTNYILSVVKKIEEILDLEEKIITSYLSIKRWVTQSLSFSLPPIQTYTTTVSNLIVYKKIWTSCIQLNFLLFLHFFFVFLSNKNVCHLNQLVDFPEEEKVLLIVLFVFSFVLSANKFSHFSL